MYSAKDNSCLLVQYLVVLKHILVTLDIVLFVRCPTAEDLFLTKEAKSLIAYQYPTLKKVFLHDFKSPDQIYYHDSNNAIRT